MAKWDFDIDGLMPSSIGFYAAPTLFMKDWDDNGKRDTIKDWGVWFNKVSTTHNFITVFPFQLAGDDPYADKYSPYKDGKKRKWWWRRYRRFIKLAAQSNITIIPIGYSKYQERMFPDIYNNKLFLKYWADLVHQHMKHCPHPRFRFSNEVSRQGWIGECGPNAMNIIHLHEEMYEIIESAGGRLETCHMDVSGSDFAKCEEIGYLLKHKVDNDYKPVMRAEYVKWSPQERQKWSIADVWGKTRYDRRGGIEWHQATLGWLSAETEPGSGTTYFDVMNGAWKWFIWNADGVTDWNGYEVPGTPWRGPTDSEIRAWSRKGFDFGTVWLETFPMSIFIEWDGMLVEDKDLINWTHLAIMREEFERA